MATYEYTPTDWETGQVISEELLDHIEDGIANAYTGLNEIAGSIVNTEATSSSSGLMSATDKVKLDSLDPNGEANVQANWLEADSTSDSYINNKPDLSIYTTEARVAEMINAAIPSVADNTVYPNS